MLEQLRENVSWSSTCERYFIFSFYINIGTIILHKKIYENIVLVGHLDGKL
jgi:hypothetical protein